MAGKESGSELWTALVAHGGGEAAVLRLHLNVPSGREIPLERVERAVRMVHRRARREISGAPPAAGAGPSAVGHPEEAEGEGELSITFLEDGPIRELNRRYLDHDWVPDVLAFTFPDPPPLGDVYVGLDQAIRQAQEEGVSLEEELVRLAVHGTLHVLGSGHPEAPEERPASAHYRLQEEVVQAVMATPGEEAPDRPVGGDRAPQPPNRASS